MVMLGYYAVVAVAAGGLLVWAAAPPHSTAAASENESGSSVAATLAPGQSATAKFPPAEVAKFRGVGLGGSVWRICHAHNVPVRF